MLQKAINKFLTGSTRSTALAVAGMAALASGRKKAGVSMFAQGAWGLEQAWREAHPDFDGGIVERWEKAIAFYEETHKEQTNRTLHVIGIPMIVGGAAGLLIARPRRAGWLFSTGLFTGGWVLNIIGHALFEKNAPAFADDPLSFIAGPVWDVLQLRNRLLGGGDAADTSASDEASAPSNGVGHEAPAVSQLN